MISTEQQTVLLCDTKGCLERATHVLMLLNIRMYQAGCEKHPRRVAHKSEAVVGVTTVLYYQKGV